MNKFVAGVGSAKPPPAPGGGNANQEMSEQALMRRCDSSDIQVSIPACTGLIQTDRDPDIVTGARLRRANIYAGPPINDFVSAIADLTEIIEHNNHHHDRVKILEASLDLRCILYVYRKEFDSALSDCSQALFYSPNNAEFFICVASRMQEKGNQIWQSKT
jgi:hypothetical protein